MDRQYPFQLVNEGITHAKSIGLKALRKVEHNTPTQKTLPYLSTYKPRNKGAFNIIVQNLSILHKYLKLKEILCIHKTNKSSKQPKILKILINAQE